MREQYTTYITDDELNQWVQEVGVEAFGSESQLMKKAVEYLKQEKGRELRELANADSPLELN